jgi:hypothetical protein
VRIPSITSHDGRRALAFLAVLGGCMVQTLYLFVVTWWLQGHAEYLFYLALADVVLIFVGMTALGWQMGRRLVASAGRDGVSINDGEGASSKHTEVATTVSIDG